LVIEKKREREREYWEERKEESTLRKKRLGTRYVFFPFCLYIHSWHKIKKKHPQLFLFYPHASPWTHNSTRFLHCVFALHLHRTSHHESPSPFHSILIIINQTTFYAMLTPLPKYTNQISLTKKMQASKPFSKPYKHHISTKMPLTNTQEKNYVTLILYPW